MSDLAGVPSATARHLGVLPSCVVHRLSNPLRIRSGLVRPTALLNWSGEALSGTDARDVVLAAMEQLKGSIWQVPLDMVPMARAEAYTASAFHRKCLSEALRIIGPEQIAAATLGDVYAHFMGTPPDVFLQFLGSLEAERWRGETEAPAASATGRSTRKFEVSATALLQPMSRLRPPGHVQKSSRLSGGLVNVAAAGRRLGSKPKSVIVMDAAGVPLFFGRYLGRDDQRVDLREGLCPRRNSGLLHWKVDDEGMRLLSPVVLMDGRQVSQGHATRVPETFTWLGAAPDELLELELATMPLLPFIAEELASENLRTALDLLHLPKDSLLSRPARRSLNSELTFLADALKLAVSLPDRREALRVQQHQTEQLLAALADIATHRDIAARARAVADQKRSDLERLERAFADARAAPEQVTFRTRVVNGGWIEVTRDACLVFARRPQGISVLDVEGSELGAADFQKETQGLRLRFLLDVEPTRRILVKATAGALQFLEVVPPRVAAQRPNERNSPLATLEWLSEAHGELLLTNLADLPLSAFAKEAVTRRGLCHVADLASARLDLAVIRELNAVLEPVAKRLASQAATAEVEPSDCPSDLGVLAQLVQQERTPVATSVRSDSDPYHWIEPRLRCLFSVDPADWPPQCGPDRETDALPLPEHVRNKLAQGGLVTIRSLLGPDGLESMLKLPSVGRKTILEIAEAILSEVRVSAQERTRERELILAFDQAVREQRQKRRRARLKADGGAPQRS